MEKRKQISILALALITLIGGIYVISKSISDKSQSSKLSARLTPEQEKSRADMLSRRIPEGSTAEIVGNIEVTDGKILTVKSEGVTVNLNITSETNIEFVRGKDDISTGQSTEIKAGDAVIVIYEKITKNATNISVLAITASKK